MFKMTKIHISSLWKTTWASASELSQEKASGASSNHSAWQSSHQLVLRKKEGNPRINVEFDDYW